MWEYKNRETVQTIPQNDVEHDDNFIRPPLATPLRPTTNRAHAKEQICQKT